MLWNNLRYGKLFYKENVKDGNSPMSE